MVSVFYQTLYCLKNLTGLILTVWLESVKNVKISHYTVPEMCDNYILSSGSYHTEAFKVLVTPKQV